MSRIVIAKNGFHFRLHPTESCIIQVQDAPGARWRAIAQYATEAEARGRLAQLGKLQPDTQPKTQEEGGQPGPQTARRNR